jgi:pyruvate/2-oxoacid:ferredoxin oxidoreductase alpha subunit
MGYQLVKGNEAIIKGAILAGCRSYYGYPITPASEIAETAAKDFPASGGTFVQAESETAAINMVFGAASTGERTMTASSGPGLSLMQEGISYLHGAELPCVVVDVMRGGPGLGNIAPEQSDYNQACKGGGHGSYNNIVYAPAFAQEMCSLTMNAFDIADQYRRPVMILADGCTGQIMEPVEFPSEPVEPPVHDWAVRGDAETRQNLITSIYMDPEVLEPHNLKLMALSDKAAAELPEWREYKTEDADIVLVGYGIMGRVLRSAVDLARAQGIKAGLIRPITLWPFPDEPFVKAVGKAKRFLAVELSNGQMVHDVRLAIGSNRPVGLYSRHGGMLPHASEICEILAGKREEDHVYERAV